MKRLVLRNFEDVRLRYLSGSLFQYFIKLVYLSISANFAMVPGMSIC